MVGVDGVKCMRQITVSAQKEVMALDARPEAADDLSAAVGYRSTPTPRTTPSIPVGGTWIDPIRH
jgi:hypothetical protein